MFHSTTYWTLSVPKSRTSLTNNVRIQSSQSLTLLQSPANFVKIHSLIPFNIPRTTCAKRLKFGGFGCGRWLLRAHSKNEVMKSVPLHWFDVFYEKIIDGCNFLKIIVGKKHLQEDKTVIRFNVKKCGDIFWYIILRQCVIFLVSGH